ncbi:MAG: hypothetical protein DCC49_12380 [Acidobacteria bacterium]|nr:MAG: hypothetical protein DCC49_12380 [Acidobacteriota bacterium]
MSDRVEFFFDPLCPWAYQTSIWIKDVRGQIGLEIAWSFFSLEEINRPENKKHPWERDWAYGWSLMRIGALLRRRSMEDLERWYSVVGEALHARGAKSHRREVAEHLAEEAGFGAEVVGDALADETTAAEVKSDHHRAVTEFGAFGVPTLVFADGQSIFGPKVTPAPRGPEALDLWEMVVAWRDFPYLYELKRPQRATDIAHIAKSFSPYLEARDWQTIEKPAPGS